MAELTIRALCEELTELSTGDITIIEQLGKQLPVMAELTMADLFVDCLSRDGLAAVVIANGKPSGESSLYNGDVVGAAALPGNEPGVFEVFRTGKPVFDSRGVSQEGVPIRQNIVPIMGAGGIVIAVLIQEQNISEIVELQSIIRSPQLTKREYEQERRETLQSVEVREMQHRIDNQLQTIASLMRLQLRRLSEPAVKEAFSDSLNRIEGIVRIHRKLSQDGTGTINPAAGLSELCTEMLAVIKKPEQAIELICCSDPVELSADRFSTLCLILNELLQNAVKYTVRGDGKGAIAITLKQKDPGFVELVWDEQGDGCRKSNMADEDSLLCVTELAENRMTKPLGLSIIQMLAEEKLQGKLQRRMGEGCGRVSLLFATGE